jgi:Protein of unknown function (DUF1566)
MRLWASGGWGSVSAVAFVAIACSSHSSGTHAGTGAEGGTGGGVGGSDAVGGSNSGGSQNSGGSIDQGGAAGQGAATGEAGSMGQDGGAGAGGATSPACGRPRSVWATWPMPNPPSTGLPNPASYDTSVAGVVCDEVTGLLWQREVDSVAIYTRSEASAHCDELELAGYDDWRLPTRIELVSLLDPGVQPTIDSTAFPNTPLAHFWTVSPYVGNAVDGWFVGFQYGLVEHQPLTTSSRARCVR